MEIKRLNEEGLRQLVKDIYNKVTAMITPITTRLSTLEENNASSNVIPNNATTSTVRGVTITKNEDGTITTSGQNDGVGTSSVLLCDGYRIPKGTYRLVGTPSNLGGFQGQAYINIYSKVGTSYTLLGVDNTQGVNVTLSQDTDITVELVASTKGGTVTGLTFKPMLTKDLNATYEDYVPYGGQSNAVLTAKLSMYEDGGFLGNNLYSYGDISATGYITVPCNLKAGTYTLSAIVTSTDTTETYNLVRFSNGGDDSIATVFLGRNIRESQIVTLSSKCTQIYFYASRNYASSTGKAFTFKDIKIEKGEEATPFNGYAKSNIEITQELTTLTEDSKFNTVTTTQASGISSYNDIGISLYKKSKRVNIEIGVQGTFTNGKQIGTYDQNIIRGHKSLSGSACTSSWTDAKTCAIMFQNGSITYNGASANYVVATGSVMV